MLKSQPVNSIRLVFSSISCGVFSSFDYSACILREFVINFLASAIPGWKEETHILASATPGGSSWCKEGAS